MQLSPEIVNKSIDDSHLSHYCKRALAKSSAGIETPKIPKAHDTPNYRVFFYA
jgi:hypothetical protein